MWCVGVRVSQRGHSLISVLCITETQVQAEYNTGAYGDVAEIYHSLSCTHFPPGGGGGGTQMLFGRGCAAEASKPVPIFKGHFGGKGYPLLGVWRKRVPIIRDF